MYSKTVSRACTPANLSRLAISKPGTVQASSSSSSMQRQGCCFVAGCKPLAAHNPALHPASYRSAAAAASSLSSAVEFQQQQQADSGASSDGEPCLHDLLVWLVNNGVSGVGMDDSSVALYEDQEGDRGIIAVQDISAGQQIVRVPLRLAITDVLEEQLRKQLVQEGALWQDRLVAKLLGEVARGRQSPWYPYIKALPKFVPSALESFSQTDALAVQLPAVTAAIQQHADKMAASWKACRPDAISGADLQTYRWAHSLVMSRTFGNAAQHGGIGVRMLCPLIDMLNHAGDETASGLLGDTAVPKDNVRWDVVSPDSSPAGCWEMLLSATQDIAADTPLLLSYFEGGSDEYLLHYGFVPASNPHDAVTLFPSITAALEHLWRQQVAQVDSPSDELTGLYRQALDAGLEALQQEVAAAAAGSDDSSSWGPLLDALEPIKIASGSRVSGPLIAALEVLHHQDMAAVEAAVAGLAWQQLQALPTPLLTDLALLVADGQEAGDGEAVQLYGRLLRHYTQAVVPDYAPGLLSQLSHAAASAASSSSSSSSDGTAVSDSAAALFQAKKNKRAVPGPPLSPAAAAAAAAAPLAPSPLAAAAVDVSKLPLQLLVGVLLSGEPDDTACSSSTGQLLSPATRMAVKFRVSKKMLLMDVVLALPRVARVSLSVLEQQQQRAEKAAAAAAGMSSSCHALPWHAV